MSGNCPLQTFSSRGPTPYEDFYQVNEPEIRELAYEILRHYSCASCSPIKKIVYFVKKHFMYKSDKANFGMVDFWQFPTEVLQLGSGDCDCLAFFTGSLLESVGVPTRVCLGNTPFGYHAWLEAADSDGEWLLIETTNGQIHPWVHRWKLGYYPDLYINPYGCSEPEDKQRSY